MTTKLILQNNEDEKCPNCGYFTLIDVLNPFDIHDKNPEVKCSNCEAIYKVVIKNKKSKETI